MSYSGCSPSPWHPAATYYRPPGRSTKRALPEAHSPTKIPVPHRMANKTPRRRGAPRGVSHLIVEKRIQPSGQRDRLQRDVAAIGLLQHHGVFVVELVKLHNALQIANRLIALPGRSAAANG